MQNRKKELRLCKFTCDRMSSFFDFISRECAIRKTGSACLSHCVLCSRIAFFINAHCVLCFTISPIAQMGKLMIMIMGLSYYVSTHLHKAVFVLIILFYLIFSPPSRIVLLVVCYGCLRARRQGVHA